MTLWVITFFFFFLSFSPYIFIQFFSFWGPSRQGNSIDKQPLVFCSSLFTAMKQDVLTYSASFVQLSRFSLHKNDLNYTTMKKYSLNMVDKRHFTLTIYWFMSTNVVPCLLTVPVELVHRILDHLNDYTILISLRNLCT